MSFCLGVYYAWGIPVPIPNTEVKPRRAYGTAVLTVGESVNAKTEFRMIRSQDRDVLHILKKVPHMVELF